MSSPVQLTLHTVRMRLDLSRDRPLIRFEDDDGVVVELIHATSHLPFSEVAAADLHALRHARDLVAMVAHLHDSLVPRL